MSKTISAVKVIKWTDFDNDKEYYGVDVKVKNKWYHCKGETGPYFFLTKEAAKKEKERIEKENNIQPQPKK